MFFTGALDLMKLQGQMRVKFMSLGVGEEEAAQCAEEALHLVATSTVVKPEVRRGYEASLENSGET